MAQLDHLVWAVPELAAGVAEFTAATGVRPQAGGRHRDRGTANYLVALGGRRYLELIGPDPDSDRPPSWFGLPGLTRPALVGWAVRTADIATAVRAARVAGYDPGEPAAMNRDTGSGQLRWQLTPAAGVRPFLIDWGTSTHPSENPLPRLELIAFEVHGDDRLRADLAALGLDGGEICYVPAADSGLTTVLGTPNGSVTLTS